MPNAKSPMTKEFPNRKRQNLAKLPAQRSCLEFRAWSFLGHLPLVICHSTARLVPVVLLLIASSVTKAVTPNETPGRPVSLEFQPLPAAEKASSPVLHLRGKDARQHALELARRVDNRTLLWRACLLGSDDARERGNTGLATSLREEARAIVRSVADSLSDKRLRATFLTGSEVADLLRGDATRS